MPVRILKVSIVRGDLGDAEADVTDSTVTEGVLGTQSKVGGLGINGFPPVAMRVSAVGCSHREPL